MKKYVELKADEQKVRTALDNVLDVINDSSLNALEVLETLSMATVVFVAQMRRDNVVQDIETDILERAFLHKLKIYSKEKVNFRDYVEVEYETREKKALPIVVRLMGLIRSGKITSRMRNIDITRMICALDKEAS